MGRELQVDIALDIEKAMRGLQRSIDDLAFTIETRLDQAVSRGLSMQKSATKNPFKVYIAEAEKTVAKINKIFDYIDLKKGVNNQLESIKKVDRALEILNRQYSQLGSGRTQAKTAAERQTLANIEDLIARTKSYKKELEDKIAAENINTMAQQAAKKEYKALEEAIDDVSFAIDRNIEKEKRRNAALAAANKQDIKKLGKEIDYETGGLDDIIANAQKKEQIEKKRLAAVLKAEQENFAKEMLLAKKSLENTIAIADKKIAAETKYRNTIKAVGMDYLFADAEAQNYNKYLAAKKAANAKAIKNAVAADYAATDNLFAYWRKKEQEKLALKDKNLREETAASYRAADAQAAYWKKKQTDAKAAKINKIDAEIANYQTQLRDSANKKLNAGFIELNKNIEKNVGLIANWYNHFGRVALGFTIAYRAMNAFEAGLRNTYTLIKEAILDTGELAGLQAELATYYALSKNDIGNFSEYMARATVNVEALRKASLTSVSTLQELSVAYSELAQHGVYIEPERMAQFTAVNDAIVQISKSTGDNIKQIRSEWQGLLEGQQKATNSFLVFLRNSGQLSEEEVKTLKAIGDQGELVRAIFDRVGDSFKELQKQLLASKPDLAFAKWREALKSGIMMAVQDVSREAGVENIFGSIAVKHIENLNKIFSSGESLNAYADGIRAIADAFDKLLTLTEDFIKASMKTATWIEQNYELLKATLSILVQYKILKEIQILAFAAAKTFLQFSTGAALSADALVVLNRQIFMTVGLATALSSILSGLANAFASEQVIDITKDAVETAEGQYQKAKEMFDEFLRQHNQLNAVYAGAPFKGTEAEIAKYNEYLNILKGQLKVTTEAEAAFKKVDKTLFEAFGQGTLDPTIAILDSIGNAWDSFGPTIDNENKQRIDTFRDALTDTSNAAAADTKDTYEDALKEISDLTTNFYQELQKAIADSDFAAFDKLLAPTTKELEIKLRETREEYENLVVLAASTPEGLLKDKLELKGLETAKKLKELQEQYDGLADSMQEADLAYFLEEDQKAASKWIEATLDNIQRLQISLAEIDSAKKYMTEEQYLKALGKAGADSIEISSKVVKEWYEDLDEISKDTINTMKNAIGDFFSDGFKGELESFKDYFESFADSISDIWGTALADALIKNKGDFLSVINEMSDTMAYLGLASASLQAAKSKNPYQMAGTGLGAALGGAFGGLPGAAVGASFGGMFGGMFGGGKSYGSQLHSALKPLIEELKSNTEATKLNTKELLSGADFSSAGIIEKYFSPALLEKSVFGDRSLLENLKLPNVFEEVTYVSKKLEATVPELNYMFTELFASVASGETSLIDLTQAFNLMSQGDSGALVELLYELPGAVDVSAEQLSNIIHNVVHESRNAGKTGEAIVAELEDIFVTIGNEATKLGLTTKESVEGIAEQYNLMLGDGFDTAVTDYAKTFKDLDKTFTNTREQAEDLLALYDAGLIDLDESIVAVFRNLDVAYNSIKTAIEEHYQELRTKTFTDSSEALGQLTGTFSQLDSAIKEVHSTWQDLIDAFIDAGGVEGSEGYTKLTADHQTATRAVFDNFWDMSTAGMSDYQIAYKELQDSYADYVQALKKEGLYTEYAAEAAAKYNYQLSELKKSFTEPILEDASYVVATNGMTALEKAIYDVNKRYQEQYDILKEIDPSLVASDSTFMQAWKISLQNAQDSVLESMADYYAQLKIQVEDLIWDLQGGSLAPVQSMEGMAIRYQKLYEEALQTGDIDRFTSFISGEFVDFVKSYGNYGEVNARIIDDLNNLEDKLVNEASLSDVNSLLIDANMTLTDIADGIATLNQMLGAAKGFASGGNHEGGFRIVGETGRELEYTGPSRIFNSDSTEAIIAAMNGGSNGNVTVNVTIGNEQIKNYIANVIRTDSETQKHIKRAARA